MVDHCGWCSTAIMVPSLNKAPILATGRWPVACLTFVAFAQELLSFTCELIRGSVGASPRGCTGLHRSALRSRLMAARFRRQGPLLVRPRVAEAALLPPNDTACAEFWMPCSGLGQAQQL